MKSEQVACCGKGENVAKVSLAEKHRSVIDSAIGRLEDAVIRLNRVVGTSYDTSKDECADIASLADMLANYGGQVSSELDGLTEIIQCISNVLQGE